MAASRNARRLWRIGSGVLVAELLILGATQVVLAISHEKYTVEEVFDAAGIVAIEIGDGAGNVQVIGTDTETIKVTAQVSDGLRETGHEEHVDGNHLVVRSSCPILSSFCGVDYTVEAPADVDIYVLARGAITASNLDGNVDLRADHGQIDASDIGGNTSMHTDHGSITATKITATSVDAGTDHGRISIRFEAAPRSVQAATDHGDIEVSVPEDGTDYNVSSSHTDQGLVSTPITTDPNSSRPIMATADHGDVTIRYGD